MSMGSATPLIGLEAIVLDCETTGLDPAKSRVVDLAAVRLSGGKLDGEAPFRSLVRPPSPIPPASTAIHGIDAAAVVAAPPFPEVWPRYKAYAGNMVVIGYSIGFDLAVLKHECDLAGLPWQRPRSLCAQLLARVVAPNLAGHSLEQVGAWLGLGDPVGRHSALGDAAYTAKVFLALVPRLRERGIRTLAEAEQATRGLGAALADQHRAGWVEAVIVPGKDGTEPSARIDIYPYRNRVAGVMSAPAKVVAADMMAEAALRRMTSEQVSSLLVAEPGKEGAPLAPQDAGIVTERDLMRAVAAHGANALTKPVGELASRPLEAVSANAFVYRAISRMNRLRVRHLGVVGADNHVVGVVSARDLLSLRAEAAIGLGDAIDQSEDVGALARAWADLPRVAASLIAEDVPAIEAAAVISSELAALTRRAAIIAEQRLGAPPCPYAFTVLGSAGRGESLLAMDQDNALVFAEGEPNGAEDRWFGELGGIVADILDEVGVPYCKGGVMAREPSWRGSLATWRRRIEEWVGRSRPQDLLSVDIFFDMRAVHANPTLGDTVWREAFDLAHGKPAFAKLLAEASGDVSPGLTLFGGFRTEEGRIDLKRAGLFGIVSTARVLAISHHVLEHATPARLEAVAALGVGGEDLTALVDAHRTFVDLILAQQVEDIANGLPPSNRIATRPLSHRDRDRLHQALRAVQHLDALKRDLLFRG